MNENENENQRTHIVLNIDNRVITLIGTAHVSKESIDEVTEAIDTIKPDCIAIELDNQRLASMQDPEAYKKLDIVKVLKEGRGFMMMANLVLSSFQKKIGSDMGVKPGDEMKAAINKANELNIPTIMVDRPIQTTLKRAWAKNSFWGKMKLFASLFGAIFDKEEISTEQIEALKKSNEMDAMMDELSKQLPVVKEVLIDERDQYLASKIWEAKGSNIVAVLGAGHLPGIERYLKSIHAGEKTSDTTEIESLPKKGIGGKILGWIFPAFIVGAIVAGFFVGGVDASLDLLLNWLIWNGSLAALGSLLALGHPVTILVGFLGAPLGTLNPFIAVGIFTGIVQATLCKPKVEDMEKLNEAFSSLKGIYKNRISRVLLVFFLSSLGGTIGNFIAVPTLISGLF